jgi:hypothetical protein
VNVIPGSKEPAIKSKKVVPNFVCPSTCLWQTFQLSNERETKSCLGRYRTEKEHKVFGPMSNGRDKSCLPRIFNFKLTSKTAHVIKAEDLKCTHPPTHKNTHTHTHTQTHPPTHPHTHSQTHMLFKPFRISAK